MRNQTKLRLATIMEIRDHLAFRHDGAMIYNLRSLVDADPNINRRLHFTLMTYAACFHQELGRVQRQAVDAAVYTLRETGLLRERDVTPLTWRLFCSILSRDLNEIDENQVVLEDFKAIDALKKGSKQ